MGRPPLPLGAHGEIVVVAEGDRFVARTHVRDRDGRTRRVTARGASRAEASRRLRAALTERTGPTSGSVTGATRLVALVDGWFDWASARGRPSPQTLRVYRSAANTALDLLGGLQVSECTVPALATRLASMDERVPTQARIARIVLRAAFALAVRNGAIAMNPMRELVPVVRSRPVPRALTGSEDARLRDLVRAWRTLRDEDGNLAPGPRPTSDLADLVDLLLGTGMRVGEALALRWEDFDLAAVPPTLTVAGTLVDSTGGLRRQDHTKTDAGFRRLTLPDDVVAVLRRRLPAATSEKLFTTKNGTWVAPNNMRRSLRSALAGSDLAWATFHTFRRTVATRIEQSPWPGFPYTPPPAALAIGGRREESPAVVAVPNTQHRIR